jgi:hypothetical protein
LRLTIVTNSDNTHLSFSFANAVQSTGSANQVESGYNFNQITQIKLNRSSSAQVHPTHLSTAGILDPTWIGHQPARRSHRRLLKQPHTSSVEIGVTGILHVPKEKGKRCNASGDPP